MNTTTETKPSFAGSVLHELTRDRPEDAIPDLPENAKAREFLKNAPAKGLWMPLGIEVKVMQCWRCKVYGHRSGDKECPLTIHGNLVSDSIRQAQEDPLALIPHHSNEERSVSKHARLELLKELVAEIKAEEAEHAKRHKHKKHKSNNVYKEEREDVGHHKKQKTKH